MSRSTSYTAIKQELLKELEKVPEDTLAQVLSYVRSQIASSDMNAASGEAPNSDVELASSDEVQRAYMASEKQYEEVYRRLADS